jgi:hypothetical protein
VQGIRSRLAVAGTTAVYLLSATGCSVETFYNQTASLGGNVAGSAGELRVAFINNTPFRAIFTYGTYNNTDQFDRPDAGQFVGNVRGTTLEGESTADIVTLSCDRVFAIGDPELLRLIEENGAGDLELDDEALLVGVGFSDAELGTEAAGLATEGFAPEVRALLGVDFPCSSIVVIRFEVDQLGDAPFRADFEVIPPAEDNPR